MLVAQGLSRNAGERIASPSIVLPFLYIAVGAPTIFAGLLLPIINVSELIGQSLGAPVLASATRRKTYVAVGSIAIAASLGIIAISIRSAQLAFLTLIFLIAAIVIGLGQGVGNLAYQAMLPSLLESERRKRLLFLLSIGSAVFALIVAWAMNRLFQDAQSLTSHATLVWIAAGLSLVAALAVWLVHETSRSDADGGTKPARSSGRKFVPDLVTGWRVTMKTSWFPRYLVSRLLFLSVVQSLPFYAIHAASLHKDTVGSLSSFVIATSLGSIVGGLVWTSVARLPLRVVMCVAAIVAAAAGSFAIVIGFTPGLQTYQLYMPVFFLMTLAMQGGGIAQTVYLGEMAPEANRDFFFATAQVTSGIAGVAVAFVLGYLAHFQGVVWPIVLIVVANLVAAAFVLTLRPAQSRV
ncbi:MAG: MFS transporter [bacterium]|nr:MFS transporter [bacterium]